MTKGTTNGVTKAQIKQFRTVLEAKAEEIQTSLGSSKAAKALDRGEDPPWRIFPYRAMRNGFFSTATTLM